MGRYERLLEERYDEERGRGRPLGRYYALDSVALGRAIQANPGHAGELKRLHQLLARGVGGMGQAYMLKSLTRRFPEAQAKVKAERDGEPCIQPEVL